MTRNGHAQDLTIDSDNFSQQPPIYATSRLEPPRLEQDSQKLRKYKRQALQSVFFTAGKTIDSDAGGLSTSFFEAGIGSGIPLGSFDHLLGVTPRVRIDWLENASQLDLPSHLYAFDCQFFYRNELNEKLSVLGIVSPSIRSDLTTSDQAVRFFALGLLNWEYVPDRLTISAGAVMLGRADLPVLPAIGLLWTPNSKTKFDLRFPLARAAYRLEKEGSTRELWTFISAGIGGNTWAVTRPDGNTDEFSLRDYRVMVGVERLEDGGGRCFIETGIAFGRQSVFESDDAETKYGNAILLSGGWRY